VMMEHVSVSPSDKPNDRSSIPGPDWLRGLTSLPHKYFPPGMKRQECEDDHSSPSSLDI
jgi:hypothetical protein